MLIVILKSPPRVSPFVFLHICTSLKKIQIPLNKIRQEGNYKELLEDESNTLVDLLASESDKTTDFAKSIISHILAGINEPSHPHTSLHNITRPESLSGHR